MKAFHISRLRRYERGFDGEPCSPDSEACDAARRVSEANQSPSYRHKFEEEPELAFRLFLPVASAQIGFALL